MRVDFAEVRKIPIASVLHFYKVEVRKRSNTELVAQCPLPSHPSDSKHEWTLAISTEIGKAYCHNTRCRQASNKPKGLDAIDFVCMMDNLLPLDAAKKVAELFAVGKTQHPPSKEDYMDGRMTREVFDALVGPNKVLAFELRGVDPAHPLIQARGITKETAAEFGAGFFPGKGSMANRIVFPLTENGFLVGYAGRTVLEVTPDNPKWKLPLGLVRSFLYGLERCDPSKPLILCESFWAVLWFYQHGVQAAALMGSSLTDAQEALLAPFAEIRICLDNDEAGRTAAAKIYERLKANHRVTKAFLKD